MPNIVTHTTLNKAWEEFEKLLGQSDLGLQAFARAMQGWLLAFDYKDPTLIQSGSEEVLATFRDVIQKTIQQRREWPKKARETCAAVLGSLKDNPHDHFDEIGKGIESNCDRMLNNLVELRDGVVRLLQERGYEIANADQLGQSIEELQELKKGVLANWPWSNQELPPVDREMVKRSRAAILRGEGEPVEELIRRLGGNPNNSGL